MLNLDTLIEHNLCPHKTYLAGKSISISSSQICSILISSALKYFLTRFAESKTTTLDNLNSQLNKAWYVLKKETKASLSWQEMIHLKDQLPKVFNLVNKSDEVVALNYPTGIDLKESSIGIEVDAILLRKVEPLKLVVYKLEYQTYHNHFFELKASVIEAAIKKDLPYSKCDIEINFLIVEGPHTRTLKISPLQKGTNTILSDLYKSYSQRISFPRPSLETCSQCLYKHVCNYAN